MFHVQFLTDDKKFGDVMAALSGKVMNLEWRHIVNAKVKNGAVVAKHPAGSIREALIPALIEADPKIAKGGTFTSDMMRAKVEELGGSGASLNGLTQVLLQRKVIKRVGRGQFVAVRR